MLTVSSVGFSASGFLNDVFRMPLIVIFCRLKIAAIALLEFLGVASSGAKFRQVAFNHLE
jgi:hypothetical protein